MNPGSVHRDTQLPLKASGHTFEDEIDKQPSNRQKIELRINQVCQGGEHPMQLDAHVGDAITVGA